MAGKEAEHKEFDITFPESGRRFTVKAECEQAAIRQSMTILTYHYLLTHGYVPDLLYVEIELTEKGKLPKLKWSYRGEAQFKSKLNGSASS